MGDDRAVGTKPAPDAAVRAQIEQIAQWLHDETGHPDAYPSHTWPETERDDGQRYGGFVKIVPLHGQEYFRDIARRLVARFLPPPVPSPDGAGEPVAWRWRFKDVAENNPWRYVTSKHGISTITTELVPLYATPPVRADREAIREAAKRGYTRWLRWHE